MACEHELQRFSNLLKSCATQGNPLKGLRHCHNISFPGRNFYSPLSHSVILYFWFWAPAHHVKGVGIICIFPLERFSPLQLPNTNYSSIKSDLALSLAVLLLLGQ